MTFPLHRLPHRALLGLAIGLLLSLALGAGTTPVNAAPVLPQVIAFGDVRGELRPCGCSPEGQMGGLPRRESYWTALLRGLPAGTPPPVLVDLGNNFAAPSAQGRLKLDTIQAFLGKLPVAAILPGPNELQSGYPSLDSSLPYLVTNNDVPGAFLAQRTVVSSAASAGGSASAARILILGYLSPTLVYQGSQDRFRLVPVEAGLLRRYEALVQQERPDATVLLFRGDANELAAFAGSALFTTIIAGNPSEDELKATTEWRVAGYRIPQVATKGQAALRLTLGGAGGEGLPSGAFAAAVQVDWLKDGIPDGPEATRALAAYDERVKALFFEEMSAREALAKDSPYAGAEACAACHAAPVAIWRASPHAQALHALERVGKQFDAECLACHVVGLGKAGFVSADATAHLAGVQCENCHGPARAHAANPAQDKTPVQFTKGDVLQRSAMNAVGSPPEATCRTCHHGSHSPKFSFAQYWPRIQHGQAVAVPEKPVPAPASPKPLSRPAPSAR